MSRKETAHLDTNLFERDRTGKRSADLTNGQIVIMALPREERGAGFIGQNIEAISAYGSLAMVEQRRFRSRATSG